MPLIPLSLSNLNVSSSASFDPSRISSSPAPPPYEPFLIPTPSDWANRREGTNLWYFAQQHTTFHTLQYRKCHASPAHHEYVLLFLTGGYVCRLERMGEDGDTENRRNAIRSIGIPARDCIQVFEPNNVPKFDLESTVVADIHYLRPFDIPDVLDICHAIQLHPRAKRYNLWHYNCYFFAWTIITVLARKIAGWDYAFSETVWGETCERVVRRLSDSSQLTGKGHLAFRLEHILGYTRAHDSLSIIESVRRNILPLNIPLYQRTRELLWTVDTSDIIVEKLRHMLGRSVADETFCYFTSEIVDEPAEIDSGCGSSDSEPEDNRVGSPAPGQSMSPSLFLVTTLFETALSLAHQRQPNAGTEWLAKFEDHFARACENLGSVSDDEMDSLLDKFSSVPSNQWRRAIRQMTVQPRQKSTEKSIEPAQVWEGWVWNSIREVVCRELGDVISRAEKQDVLIEYPNSKVNPASNSDLQNLIRGRIREHSKKVHRLSLKVANDVVEEITCTMENAWQRVALDDSKLERFSLFNSLQHMNSGVVGAHSGILG